MMNAIRTETPDDETVVVTAVVPASADQVYRAFTNPAELARWLWAERFATTYEIDSRHGGTFRVATTALPEDQSMGAHGTFLELSPTRLALSWRGPSGRLGSLGRGTTSRKRRAGGHDDWPLPTSFAG